jgi:hypothetical protein
MQADGPRRAGCDCKEEIAMTPEEWRREIDKAVERAATTISNAVDQMVNTLPRNAKPQEAMGLLVEQLSITQPALVQMIRASR